jgi:DNA-binding winged helix-turn-helix (wHTH) protein/tetratricopeptide (TPR) repeat protein
MADGGKRLHFGSFCLDLDSERLWRGGDPVPLRPKAWALLRYLAERPERLVSKEELLVTVWHDVTVTGATLQVTIRNLREALGDDARQPRYIETVRSRGYRFVAPVTVTSAGDESPASPRAAVEPREKVLVGRERELARLGTLLGEAEAGRRQVVLVSGEAGIGKTWLVDAFVRSTAWLGGATLYVGRGQCVESHGEAEPYMPVFEALAELQRGPDGDRVTAALHRRAPVVLAQMPGWLPHEHAERLLQSMLGSRSGRMLRLMADAVEAVAAVKPLLLIIEDLHWSDASTIDLIATIAQRREPARFMFIATCRPVEAALRDHALARLRTDLLGRQLCMEMALDLLDEDAVHEYVRLRFEQRQAPPGDKPASNRAPDLKEMGTVIYRRTEGNPFLVSCLLDSILARNWPPDDTGFPELAADIGTIAALIPTDVASFVAHQLSPLAPEERRTLEVASVAGVDVSAPLVAAILDADPVAIDLFCYKLARGRHLLRELEPEVQPDGSVAARYGFRHVMVRQALYDRLPISERRRIHRRVGEYLETAHARRLDEAAATLADHFERAGDEERAATYLERAAEHARRRCAYTEEIQSLRRALDLLERCGEPVEAERRWKLQLALGEAHWRAGERVLAHHWFDAALARARECHTPLPLAQTALAHGRTLRLPDIDRSDDFVNLTREALEAAGEANERLRAQLLSKLSFALYFRPAGWESQEAQQRRLDLSDEAYRLARRLGEPAVSIAVLYDRHWSGWAPDNLEERQWLASELAALAGGEHDLEMLAEAHFFRFCNSLEAGHRDATSGAVAALNHLAEELHHRWYGYLGKVHRAALDLLSGRFVEAQRWMEQARTLGKEIDEPVAEQIFGAQLLMQTGMLGSFQGFEESATSLAEHFSTYATYGANAARILAELGRLDGARRQIDRLASNDFGNLRRDNTWLATMALLSIAVARCGDSRRAAMLYDLLIPHSHQGIVLHGGFAYLGTVARHLGLLSTMLKMWEAAEKHFGSALVFDESLGAMPWLAQTRCDYAGALLNRGRPSDQGRAQELLRQALSEASQLGMTNLAEKCRAIGQAVPPGHSDGAVVR